MAALKFSVVVDDTAHAEGEERCVPEGTWLHNSTRVPLLKCPSYRLTKSADGTVGIGCSAHASTPGDVYDSFLPLLEDDVDSLPNLNDKIKIGEIWSKFSDLVEAGKIDFNAQVAVCISCKGRIEPHLMLWPCISTTAINMPNCIWAGGNRAVTCPKQKSKTIFFRKSDESLVCHFGCNHQQKQEENAYNQDSISCPTCSTELPRKLYWSSQLAPIKKNDDAQTVEETWKNQQTEEFKEIDSYKKLLKGETISFEQTGRKFCCDSHDSFSTNCKACWEILPCSCSRPATKTVEEVVGECVSNWRWRWQERRPDIFDRRTNNQATEYIVKLYNEYEPGVPDPEDFMLTVSSEIDKETTPWNWKECSCLASDAEHRQQIKDEVETNKLVYQRQEKVRTRWEKLVLWFDLLWGCRNSPYLSREDRKLYIAYAESSVSSGFEHQVDNDETEETSSNDFVWSILLAQAVQFNKACKRPEDFDIADRSSDAYYSLEWVELLSEDAVRWSFQEMCLYAKRNWNLFTSQSACENSNVSVSGTGLGLRAKWAATEAKRAVARSNGLRLCDRHSLRLFIPLFLRPGDAKSRKAQRINSSIKKLGEAVFCLDEYLRKPKICVGASEIQRDGLPFVILGVVTARGMNARTQTMQYAFHENLIRIASDEEKDDLLKTRPERWISEIDPETRMAHGKEVRESARVNFGMSLTGNTLKKNGELVKNFDHSAFVSKLRRESRREFKAIKASSDGTPVAPRVRKPKKPSLAQRMAARLKKMKAAAKRNELERKKNLHSKPHKTVKKKKKKKTGHYTSNVHLNRVEE